MLKIRNLPIPYKLLFQMVFIVFVLNLNVEILLIFISTELFFYWSNLKIEKIFIFEDLKTQFLKSHHFWETNKCTQLPTQERYLYH